MEGWHLIKMLAERDIGTQVDSFHGAVCPIQGCAAATLMYFCVHWGGRGCEGLGITFVISIFLQSLQGAFN